MKNLSLLVWLTQLGFSVAVPPAGFILLAVWLRARFDLGVWVILAGVGLGVICAPMDCSPPGSSVHEIFQTRILEC